MTAIKHIKDSTKITDVEYFKLSEAAYRNINEKIYNHPIKVPVDKTLIRYKRLQVLDNPANGAQGFAAAPVRDGKVDTSQIVIAYRGTQSVFNEDDVMTDFEQILEGKKDFTKEKMDYTATPDGSVSVIPITEKVGSQFTTALRFADEIQKKYPHARLTTTGHSLGGGLAQAVAVEKSVHAVTFAAPNVYQLLSKEGKARVRSGETKRLIIDYTHHNDIVGTFSEFGAPPIGRQLFVKEGSSAPNSFQSILLSVVEDAFSPTEVLKDLFNRGISGHFLNTFADGFNEDGSADLLLDPDAVHEQTNKLRQTADQLNTLQHSLEEYADHEEERVRRLENKYCHETEAGGRFSLLDNADVIDCLREVAPYRSHGSLCFYDPVAYSDLLTDLNAEKIKIDEFAGRVDYAARQIEDHDRGAAATIKELIE